MAAVLQFSFTCSDPNREAFCPNNIQFYSQCLPFPTMMLVLYPPGFLRYYHRPQVCTFPKKWDDSAVFIAWKRETERVCVWKRERVSEKENEPVYPLKVLRIFYASKIIWIGPPEMWYTESALTSLPVVVPGMWCGPNLLIPVKLRWSPLSPFYQEVSSFRLRGRICLQC